MKILLVEPGAATSTLDVSDGLAAGLTAHGVTLVRYALDSRIGIAKRILMAAWHQSPRKATLPKPSEADIFYQAGVGAIERALRHQVDVVLVVSAMFLHPDVLVLLKRAGLRVVVLLTESPYNLEQELAVARLVDAVWTTERTAVAALRGVVPRAGYLPHAWHPDRHAPGPHAGDDAVRAHDVVLVGTGFAERIAWLEAMDWSGIDLGLYGQWEALARRSPLRKHVHGGIIPNQAASALYRRAAIGLNLYRAAPAGTVAESLNPRAYELARCGVPHVSTLRAEVVEKFGALVPTARDPHTMSALVRAWLADPGERARVAAALPAVVSNASWRIRAIDVLEDLHGLVRAA